MPECSVESDPVNLVSFLENPAFALGIAGYSWSAMARGPVLRLMESHDDACQPAFNMWCFLFLRGTPEPESEGHVSVSGGLDVSQVWPLSVVSFCALFCSQNLVEITLAQPAFSTVSMLCHGRRIFNETTFRFLMYFRSQRTWEIGAAISEVHRIWKRTRTRAGRKSSGGKRKTVGQVSFLMTACIQFRGTFLFLQLLGRVPFCGVCSGCVLKSSSQG